MKSSSKTEKQDFESIDESIGFMHGIRLIFNLLNQISERVSLKLGFGSLALGITLHFIEGEKYIIQVLIGLGMFSIFAILGRIVERYFKLKNNLEK